MTGDEKRSRLMTRAEAAAYCRVSADGFSHWVQSRIVPGPIPGTKRWDRVALDQALDRLSGISASEPVETPGQKALREWKERRAARPKKPPRR